ncbi:hypothetical protein FIBSPDRAFT_957338 [Athelia psychrophila]|uniref:Uncharacterized protein n=1 Tax=Athelia psychrophila TaxID=1759441 RepID=A0A166FTZ5_9AGAM|nr:hypothetical protein FIBSPDRAFT_957338 [Fibularhizoctonia sp. CBS 109695]
MSWFSGKLIRAFEVRRTKPVNAFSNDLRFWTEYGQVLDNIAQSGNDGRAAVMPSALPKIFTAGIDFASLADTANFKHRARVQRGVEV